MAEGRQGCAEPVKRMSRVLCGVVCSCAGPVKWMYMAKGTVALNACSRVQTIMHTCTDCMICVVCVGFACRALKTKGNTPKYGLIYHSSFIGKAGAKNKGRISRYLANKCSIAARIDCFSGESADSLAPSTLNRKLSFFSGVCRWNIHCGTLDVGCLLSF